MSYWENTLSNQPLSNLRWSRYSSKAACDAAQAATGGIVYPDQCVFVDTTPAPIQPPPQQQPDTQPVINVPAVQSPAAGAVQVAGISIDPKIIIALILVLLFGFLLSRK